MATNNLISELPVSPCNARMFRALSPNKVEHRRRSSKNEECRPISRRSYSFPSTRPKSYRVLEKSGNLQSIYNHNANVPSRHSSNKKSSKRTSKSHRTEETAPCKSDDAEIGRKDLYDTYQSTEQYELEGSRPRQSQSQIGFNVFEYIENLEKEHDPMGYLQPNNLKPFGSLDNSYVPVGAKPSTNRMSKDEEQDEEIVKNSKKQNVETVQKRDYSTKPWRKSNSTQNLIQMLPPIELTKKSSGVAVPKAGSVTLEHLPISKTRSKSFPAQAAKLESVCDHDQNSFKVLGIELHKSNGNVPRPAYSSTVKSNFNDIYGYHMPNRKSKSTFAMSTSTDASKLKQHAVQVNQKPSQNRSLLSTESVVLNKRNSSSKNLESKKSLSSTALNQNHKHLDSYSIQNYSKTSRPLEPDSCEKVKTTKKCFLPSRIRLKPPKCTPKPPPCPKEEKCPPRADDTAVFNVKPLPIITVSEDCPCLSPVVPSENPKMKRLKFNFKDPPRICPIEGPICPPRADDTLREEYKRLPLYEPKDCPCVEPPPMIDKPLRRLKKVCIPPEVCKPVRVCPKPEPCERADDTLVEKHKELPMLEAPHCPCIIAPPKDEIPPLKRLNLKAGDPPRLCPKPCICNVDCPRADDTWKELPKKLPKLIPKDCPCIDSPIEDVKPLKRLECIEEPEECYETDPCIDIPRADMGCWEYWLPEEKSKPGKKAVSHNSKRKYNTDARRDDSVQDALSKSAEIDSKTPKTTSGPLKNIATSTMDLLNELNELDSTRGSIQVQNVRNLSSKVRDNSKKKKKVSEEESCVKPQHKCYTLGQKCPSMSMRSCPPVKDPCNKVCKHIRPVVTCGNRRAAPYPAFSELLDESIVPFSNSTECRANEREFHYHLEEKKIPVPKKPSTSKSKCYSTLSSSKNLEIHRSPGESNNSTSDGIEQEFVNSENTNTEMESYGKEQISDKASSKRSYHTDSYNQKCDLDKQQKEKLNLKQSRSPTVQSSRFVSHTVKKSGVEAIKTPPNKAENCKENRTLCPKIKAPKCPPLAKRLPTCRKEFPIVCQKLNAPFKAFTDCLDELDEELAEKLSECPLEKNKIRYLQPDYVKTLDNTRLVPPVTPKVGKLDLTAEDDCVRRRLCLEKGGFTRSCCDLKKPIKPMRAKDLEKLKGELHKGEQEQNNYHDQTARSCKRKFCTWASNPLAFQRRGLCRSVSEINFRRNYHLLCKTQEKYLEDDFDDKIKTTPHRGSKEHEDSNKTKLGSVQWRVDNFQKWHRLNKLNSHSSPLKRFHSCPDFSKDIQRMYSTVVSNTVSHHTNDDITSCRTISTTNSEYAKKRYLDPRKIKLSKSFQQLKTHPSESYFQGINIIPECDYREENKLLQPIPPFTDRLVEETYPNIGQVDYNLSREYKRCKYGIKNEGITQDCSTFGTKLSCEDILFSKSRLECDSKEMVDQECDSTKVVEQTVPCKKQLEEDRICLSTEQPKPTDKCLEVSESPKQDECCNEAKNYTECPEPTVPVVVPKKPAQTRRMVFNECLNELDNDYKKCFSSCDIRKERPKVIPKEKSASMDRKSCEPKNIIDTCIKQRDTLWQKIVNYFKARPNCPPPDEWKKKALRAKAEKAAKAAGLVLCDPKDFQKMSSCCKAELPQVLTLQCAGKNNEVHEDPCVSQTKNLDKCQKRNFTTTTVSTVPVNNIYCNPLYIGQFFNKIIITVPLDSYMLGSYRFPKILSSLPNFAMQRDHPDFLKQSTTSTVTTKRFYSKHNDRKQLKGPKESKDKNSSKNLEGMGDTNKGHKDEDLDTENILGSSSVKCYEGQKINRDWEMPSSSDMNKRISARKTFFDVIFPEDFNQNPEYHQAKALAVFQEICNKLDIGTDVNVEEIEKLKTQHMLRELDKLLENPSKSQKE